ncbi:MAG: LysE family translocator [Pseudomonadota bacterium]
MVELADTLALAMGSIAWALFIPACFALNAAPGPNNVTAFVSGARMPFGLAILAGMGRLPAFALLIAITAIGLGALLAASTAALWVIKILGAVYLVYIGWKLFRTPGAAIPTEPDRAVWAAAKQDFWVAIGNPKAIAIFTAFFPQFLDPSRGVEAQILVMGGAFLVLEGLAMLLYVLAGRLMRGAVHRVGGFGLLNKGVGGFLVFSGVSLAFSARN